MTLPEGLESIGEHCFRFTAIKEITIPASVKSIERYAFNGYRKDGNYHRVLEKVVLQEGLESIEKECFYDTGLKEIHIPNTVTSIGSLCFKNTYITNIVIPNSVKKLEDKTFMDCVHLISVTLPSGLESIGEGCFKNTNLKNVTVPNDTHIANSAFPNNCEIRRE